MSAERVMMLVCGLCIGAAAVAEDAEDGEDTEHPQREIGGIPRHLNDAWDQTKRSREYLNAAMGKEDLDNIYYNHAYKK